MNQKKRYKYQIRYFAIAKSGGKRTLMREVEFTKPKEEWNRKAWEILTEYLRKMEKGFCEVVIISIKESV